MPVDDPFQASDDVIDFNSGIQVDQTKDYFTELVGEDKKFKTPQELARAKAESDAFIERLKAENSGLRGELKTRTTMEQFLEKIKPQENSQQQQPNNQQAQQQDSREFKPEDIQNLVEQTLEQRSKAAIEQQNYNTVVAKVNEVFGNDASTVIQRKAAELGMSIDNLKGMARTNPTAFLKLVDADKPVQREEAVDFFSAPPMSRQTAAPQGTGARNFSYYETIRKSDPNRYWSPALQNQLFKDAERLGDAFMT